MGIYQLPFRKNSSLKKSVNMIFLIGLLAFGAMSAFFFIIMTEGDFALGLFFGLFMLAVALYFGYIYFSAVVFKRFYIEMTEEYLKFRLSLKSGKIFWGEIFEAQGYLFNKYPIVAILLHKDREKKRRRTITNNFNSILGYPAASFQLPLNLFNNIDMDTLVLTISDRLKNVESNHELKFEHFEEEPNNVFKAILASLLCCMVSTVVYGFLIDKLEKNYIVLPMLGSYLIISAFGKYYYEEGLNLAVRLYLGVICLVQVPAAVIWTVMAEEKITASLSNVLIVTGEYIKYLIHHPLNQAAVIITAIVCFGIGIFNGLFQKKKLNEERMQA